MTFSAQPYGFRPTRQTWVPSIQTIQLSDNLLCFYDGRTRQGEPIFGRTDENWIQIDMDLGTVSYCLFDGDEALIVDTLLTEEQARYMRRQLESMGIKKFTVTITHMDPDHIGGNAVFADCEIIALKGTHDALAIQKSLGDNAMWGLPRIDPFVLPNSLIDQDEKFKLGRFDLNLLRYDAHQQGGGLCIEIPEYRAVLVGDIVEDTVNYINQPEHIESSIEETRRLAKLDIDYVLPAHGHPVKIARAEYGKPFIQAAIKYQEELTRRQDDDNYLDLKIADIMGPELEAGTIVWHEPYEWLHGTNVQAMRDYREKGILRQPWPEV